MPPDWKEQYYALCVLGYLADLFRETPRNLYSSADVLRMIELVKQDPEMFSEGVLRVYAEVDAWANSLVPVQPRRSDRVN